MNELICSSCATPIEVPATYAGSFLVCPNCGVTQELDEYGTGGDYDNDEETMS